MPKSVLIAGRLTDTAGRCRHYHLEMDVVGLKCARCQAYFACYQCHDELTDHAFVPCQKTEQVAICGACGQRMTYAVYAVGHCPACGHGFNPRCSVHAGIYFLEE